MLQDVYRRMSHADIAVQMLVQQSGLDPWVVEYGLVVLVDLLVWRSRVSLPDGTMTQLALSESILDYAPSQLSVDPAWLALRRMIDPRYTAAHRLREAMSTWRVYAGFDVSAGSPMRQPIVTESAPILAEDGHNLSAVLLWLQTSHPDLWSELETHLRSVLPNVRALQARLVGRGQTMAVWREEGVADELTLADLSDGTLRFLCWLTLCLAPRPPSLVCMDEPEIGLHPRVLPLLAGLCKRASEHTQVPRPSTVYRNQPGAAFAPSVSSTTSRL